MISLFVFCWLPRGCLPVSDLNRLFPEIFYQKFLKIESHALAYFLEVWCDSVFEIISMVLYFLQDIKDKFIAIVEMIDSGDVLKLDQAHLETVIPQPGKKHTIVVLHCWQKVLLF